MVIITHIRPIHQWLFGYFFLQFTNLSNFKLHSGVKIEYEFHKMMQISF